MLTIFLRSVILYAASLLAMRAMGKRQVGQLQPFELVVVIMIAELAATPMGGVGIPILYGLLPMAALVVCHGLLTALCMKSERVRGWLCGQPTVLVRNGVICEKQLRACAVDLNDLMEAIRAGGILDPLEVGTAVLEPGGNISVFPKADSRPLMPSDLGKMPPKEGLPLPLILDGEVQTENLQRGQLSLSWLMGQIRALGFEGVLEHHKNKRTLSFEQLHELAELARANGIPAASHDDDTAAKLQVNKELGVAISEFPITIDVARQAQQLGLATVVGAPNILLGGSHTGNLSAAEAVKEGCADILCSDYYPAAMLHSIFIMHKQHGVPLPEIVNKLTLNPARAMCIDNDYGSLAVGKKADLLIIKILDGYPVITHALVDGKVISQLEYRV